MIYLVDANVLSELWRKQSDAQVVAWFAQQPSQTLYLSVLTLGEICKGIEQLQDPLRQQPLLNWLIWRGPHTIGPTHGVSRYLPGCLDGTGYAGCSTSL